MRSVSRSSMEVISAHFREFCLVGGAVPTGDGLCVVIQQKELLPEGRDGSPKSFLPSGSLRPNTVMCWLKMGLFVICHLKTWPVSLPMFMQQSVTKN